MNKLLQSNLYVFLLLCITGFGVYSVVLPGEFLFDDNLFIENNEQIKSLSNIPSLYYSSATEGSNVAKDNFYRPNQQLVNSLLYALFGLKPVPFHICSLLFHSISAFLIFLLFIKFNLERKIAFASALIFIIHPINTQAVSYISGMADPLGLMFILLSLLCFLSYRDKKRLPFAALSVMFFVLGLLTKENTIVFPALALLSLIFISKETFALFLKNNRHSLLLILLFFSVALIYLYVKFTFLNFAGNIGLTDQKNIYTANLHIRLITFINILPEYFKMIFFPLKLNYEKPYTAFINLSRPQALLSLILLCAGGAMAGYSFLIKSRTFFFMFCWFFICLAPVSGIVPVNAMFLEHWLYFPLIGIIFGFAAMIQRQKKFLKNIFFLLFILLAIAYSIRTVLRNMQWADALVFYKNELKYSNSARMHNNLAMIYSDRQKCPLAIKHYVKAIELYDIYPQTHHNLARCYEAMGLLNDAVSEYFNALIVYPGFTHSHKNLFKIFYNAGDSAHAAVFQNYLLRLENGENINQQEIRALINSLKK